MLQFLFPNKNTLSKIKTNLIHNYGYSISFYLFHSFLSLPIHKFYNLGSFLCFYDETIQKHKKTLKQIQIFAKIDLNIEQKLLKRRENF